ncbi:MAG: cation diffusion facilitator family transporter [Pyrinomonadaceae bacterium]
MNTEHRITNAPLVGALVNALLAAIKIGGGVIGNSGALIADGLESAADVMSSLIVWGGLRFSVKPPDENHPYGHGKAEPLAAAAASFALLAAAVLIAVESIKQILTPHSTPRWYTLIILAGVIGVKALLSRFVSNIGQGIGSSALKSDALHHLSDALTSLAAFIGISIALIGGRGYESADDWAALLACLIIFFNGARLLKDAVNEVMDIAVSPEYEGRIRLIARRVEGVIDIEKCRIRKSGLHHLIDIHVEVDGDIPVRRGHEIAHQVKDALLASEHRVLDVLVHIEPH